MCSNEYNLSINDKHRLSFAPTSVMDWLFKAAFCRHKTCPTRHHELKISFSIIIAAAAVVLLLLLLLLHLFLLVLLLLVLVAVTISLLLLQVQGCEGRQGVPGQRAAPAGNGTQ